MLDVAHDIQVKPPGSARQTATDIARAVRHTLEWDVFVPDERIQSTVAGGWVVLVHFWLERQVVLAAATATPGVRSVEDRLRTEPYAARFRRQTPWSHVRVL